jgi:hypothetical protein
MGFEGEFASYEPLRRILESKKIKSLEQRIHINPAVQTVDTIYHSLVNKNDLPQSDLLPDLILSIDGGHHEVHPEKGFPGAEYGYVTIAAVLLDLEKIKTLENDDFIDPKEFRKTEKPASQESVFPGCNMVVDDDKDAKSSFRKILFEELKNNRPFPDCESLLETYEYLFRLKREKFEDRNMPDSPIDELEEKMTYGYGEYICPHSGEPLFSTDALRLHELMNPSGSSGELFGQTMSTFEKLWFVNILRAFERKGTDWLRTLRRIAFILDGPLAVFSTSSWLTKVIEIEIWRINELQKKINNSDLIVLGLEKSGTFFNHFLEIDVSKDGVADVFPKQCALLLTDEYIKKNIIYSGSEKLYGQDTYFGRKLFYKTKSGQKLVPVIAWLSSYQKDIRSANPDQFVRLGDVLELLDNLVSSRYPNSITPLISAHAEASIPLNLSTRLFETIAREIANKTALAGDAS